MTSSPLSDVVSSQYERWVYPEPILDIGRWLVGNWQWFDPIHAHLLFWPDRDYRPDLEVLVAGCGTNQAAVLAYTNPGARITAIDVSGASLDHHRYLKERYGMKNLDIHRLPIEDVASLGRDFDLIISTGVLHHLADPKLGMKALAECLRLDGVAAIMVYARYGRVGVEMMQGLFRDMGLRQNDTSLLMVREALAELPANHPVRSYLDVAPDLRFDSGLVDTFLHGRDRSYTIEDCFDLVESSGLVFQDMFLKSPYHPPAQTTGAFWHAISGLSRKAQWSAMERINFRNGCHFFTACHPSRPKSAYDIDFDSVNAASYVPVFRYRCSVDGGRVHRNDWSMPLAEDRRGLVHLVDGKRSIAEISSLAGVSPTDLHSVVELFRTLWQLDFIAVKLA